MQSLQEREDQDKKYNPAEQRHGAQQNSDINSDYINQGLEDLENHANSTSGSDQNDVGEKNNKYDPDDDTADSGWDNKTSPDKKRRFKITGKQAAGGGMAAGLLVGGGIGFFTFMAGPLQFLQFAKILERFHFDNSREFSNHRVSKLYRWATKKPKGRQDFNLSHTGNKLALHYEKKLTKQGIELDYGDGSTGRIKSIILDPDTPAGKKMIQKIEADSGASLPKEGSGSNKVRLDLATDSKSVTNARARRQLISASVSATDMNGISGAMSKRMLKIRAGVDFHPLRNLARSADEKLKLNYDKWKKDIKEKRNKSIKEGSKPPDTIKATAGDDPEKPASEPDKAKASEIDGDIADAQKIASDTEVPFKERVAGVKAKLKVGMGATAVLGIICGLDALGDTAGEIQEQNIVQPLIRLASTGVISPAGQIMSGQGVTMDELGVLADSFYNKENESSWMSAESIQHNMGKPGTGVKLPDSAKPGKDKPGFFQVIDEITSVPGMSGACRAITSTLGGLATAVAGIAITWTGPWGALLSVGSEAAQQVIANTFMDDLVRWLAGEAIDVANISGGAFGAMADTGAFLADNNSSAGMGGRTLTPNERLALENETRDRIKQDIKNEPLYARIFDMSSPDSLVSKSVIQNNGIRNTQTSFASLVRSPFSAISSVWKNLASLSPAVYAETSTFDYGVDKIGFSQPERDSPDVEDPYANEEYLKTNADIAELNTKYGEKCFGVTIDPTTSKIKYSKAPSYKKLEESRGDCGADNKDPIFLRYRMYIADTITATTMACYESIDEDACQELGLESTTSANNNPTTPILNGVECPASMSETKQVGSSTYYKLPPAPGGEYSIYSRDSRRYGQRELVCVLYTVAKAYKSMYGSQSTVDIGDLNAAGHKSHKWGVAVDLDAQGQIVAADNVNAPSKYSTEATIALGKLFVDTGYVKNIWYCSNDGAIEAIRGYAVSVGKPITIKCISGHYNHFHVDINTPRGTEDTP